MASASIGALSGPAHGGANEHSLRLFLEIGDPSGAEAKIERLLDDKYKIPGFGHRVYHVKDPRSKVIQVLAAEVVKPGIRLREIMAYSVSLGNYRGEDAERAIAERPTMSLVATSRRSASPSRSQRASAVSLYQRGARPLPL